MVHRVRSRDLFGFVGEVLLSPDQRYLVAGRGKKAKEGLVRILTSRSKNGVAEGGVAISAEDLVCQVVKIGYGKGGKNPVLVSTEYVKRV